MCILSKNPSMLIDADIISPTIHFNHTDMNLIEFCEYIWNNINKMLKDILELIPIELD